MATNLTEAIYKELSRGNSVLLVGKEDSGKTYFVENTLIPFLKNKNIKAVYFPDCNVLDISQKEDIFIVDEVETLLDKDFLEKRYPKEKPYYSSTYLETVKRWHDKLRLIFFPSIFILTRNSKEDIDYILKNIDHIDWGVPVKCLFFEKTL